MGNIQMASSIIIGAKMGGTTLASTIIKGTQRPSLLQHFVKIRGKMRRHPLKHPSSAPLRQLVPSERSRFVHTSI